MNSDYTVELERMVRLMRADVERLQADVIRLNQQLPKAWMGNGGGGSSDPPHQYLARGDGAAQATGTWPTGITPDTFTSDVVDTATNTVVATGVEVEWWNTDPLTVAGALVWCDKKPDGTFVGKIEQCNAIALDP
jgi:hypothetical protein